jgi:SNF2 family DNA or RNA helicase
MLFGAVCDRGLGKTLQALLCLYVLRIENRIRDCSCLPVLIVCPASLVFHWRSEIEKYFPNCKSMQHSHFDLNGTSTIKNQNEKLFVVSYDSLRRSQQAFRAIHWEAIVLDEAHLIRNPRSITAKTIFQLSARHRLALTGTPIQNKVFL